jgi:hypothetical protein
MNHLNGFHLAERYIVGTSSYDEERTERTLHTDLERLMIVLYHHPTRQQQAVVKATELREREEALAEEKKKLGMTD